MDFLSSIKNRSKEEVYRSVPIQQDYFSNLSPGSRSIWTFGMAHYGRLGDGQQTVDIFAPKQLECLSNVNIKSVHLDSAHNLILLECGNMISFGKCHFGQLGLGHEWMEAFTPQHIPLKVCMKSVATGTHHSLAVSENGQLYTWGCGYNGCLGHGDEHSRSTPTLVQTLSGSFCIDVAGGEYHSLATIQAGEDPTDQGVYSWGRGRQGQLGGDDFENRLVPDRIQMLQHIGVKKLVAAGNFSGALINLQSSGAVNEASLFTWGACNCGQLGYCNEKSPQYIYLSPTTVDDISNGILKDYMGEGISLPTQVPHPNEGAVPSWTDVASGGNHVLAIDNCGRLFGWGWLLPFQSSTDPGECICVPLSVNFEDAAVFFERVACGTRHSLAVTTEGDCYVAGLNNHGQLGLGVDLVGKTQNRFIRLSREQLNGANVNMADGGTNSTVILTS